MLVHSLTPRGLGDLKECASVLFVHNATHTREGMCFRARTFVMFASVTLDCLLTLGARFLNDLVTRTSSKIGANSAHRRRTMLELLRHVWIDDDGQDIAEYALMLAVVLLIVVAAVSAIGTNANTVFNSAASKLTTG